VSKPVLALSGPATTCLGAAALVLPMSTVTILTIQMQIKQKSTAISALKNQYIFFLAVSLTFVPLISKTGSCKPQRIYKSQMYIGTIWLELDNPDGMSNIKNQISKLHIKVESGIM
jgi:hypothetical protein